ncbi:hypothetical protein AAVH_15581 [Aphelenchoides avenae]|nr:hypothetical protein AAVH_15581 [Aphelenchus avenae]
MDRSWRLKDFIALFGPSSKYWTATDALELSQQAGELVTASTSAFTSLSTTIRGTKKLVYDPARAFSDGGRPVSGYPPLDRLRVEEIANVRGNPKIRFYADDDFVAFLSLTDINRSVHKLKLISSDPKNDEYELLSAQRTTTTATAVALSLCEIRKCLLRFRELLLSKEKLPSPVRAPIMSHKMHAMRHLPSDQYASDRHQDLGTRITSQSAARDTAEVLANSEHLRAAHGMFPSVGEYAWASSSTGEVYARLLEEYTTELSTLIGQADFPLNYRILFERIQNAIDAKAYNGTAPREPCEYVGTDLLKDAPALYRKTIRHYHHLTAAMLRSHGAGVSYDPDPSQRLLKQLLRLKTWMERRWIRLDRNACPNAFLVLLTRLRTEVKPCIYNYNKCVANAMKSLDDPTDAKMLFRVGF